MIKNIIKVIYDEYSEYDEYNEDEYGPRVSFKILADINFKFHIADFKKIDCENLDQFRKSLTDKNEKGSLYGMERSRWTMECVNLMVNIKIELYDSAGDTSIISFKIPSDSLIDIVDELINLRNCMQEGIKYVPINKSLKNARNK